MQVPDVKAISWENDEDGALQSVSVCSIPSSPYAELKAKNQFEGCRRSSARGGGSRLTLRRYPNLLCKRILLRVSSNPTLSPRSDPQRIIRSSNVIARSGENLIVPLILDRRSLVKQPIFSTGTVAERTKDDQTALFKPVHSKKGKSLTRLISFLTTPSKQERSLLTCIPQFAYSFTDLCQQWNSLQIVPRYWSMQCRMREKLFECPSVRLFLTFGQFGYTECMK